MWQCSLLKECSARQKWHFFEDFNVTKNQEIKRKLHHALQMGSNLDPFLQLYDAHLSFMGLAEKFIFVPPNSLLHNLIIVCT